MTSLFNKRNLIIVLLIFFLFLSFLAFRQSRLQAKQIGLCCGTDDYSGEIDPQAKIAIFEGRDIVIPQIAYQTQPLDVLGTTSSERWIEVDLSEQKLRAWGGDSLFLESLVSTGLPWWPTPTGEFHIWIKLRATKMEGGSGKYYYNLPNVPYVMFFENDKIPSWRGFGLHGTYWHNDFGNVHSHGCVNLPTDIARELYYWTFPVLPEGKNMVRADSGNLGTRIVIHE